MEKDEKHIYAVQLLRETSEKDLNWNNLPAFVDTKMQYFTFLQWQSKHAKEDHLCILAQLVQAIRGVFKCGEFRRHRLDMVCFGEVR